MRFHSKTLLSSAVFLVLVLAFTGTVIADSTAVLPKGRSSIGLEYRVAHVSREFDDSRGDRELGYYFNNLDVTSIAEPQFNLLFNDAIALARLQSGLPIPFIDPLTFDSVDRAMTYLDARVDVRAMVFAYQLGLTDKLTVGVGFPYYNQATTRIDFQAFLWPSANLVTDPVYGPIAAQAFGGALAPNGALDLTPEAQDFIMGLGYDKLNSWSGAPGIGDIRVGSKYRFLNGDMLKAAAGSWVTIPTGEPDDEKDLTDIPYGQGHYDTGLYAMVDLIPVDPVTLNLTGRYVWNWPVNRGIFMLDKNNPEFYDAELPTKHDFGDFHRGDYYELESELILEPVRGIDAFAAYIYKQSQIDTLDGHEVPATEIELTTLRVGLSVNTVESYLAKQSKAPMIISLFTEPVQTGRNAEKPVTTGISLSLIF